ncbi:ATP-binding protein [Massilia sp. W12]|uniref:ATP-binding protein n=1 Tax=Massilia sp. W12 TaxID=3126507 RepID=UPI0030CF5853
MDLYASKQRVQELHTMLANNGEGTPVSPRDFALWQELAWALRERDPQRALQIQKRLHVPDLLQQVSTALQVRHWLTQSCLHCLDAQVPAALSALQQARELLAHAPDLLLAGDLAFCHASILQELSRAEQRDQAFADAAAAWQEAGDGLRAAVARAKTLHFNAFLDQRQTRERALQESAKPWASDPLVAAWLHSALGILAVYAGDPASGIRDYLLAFSAANNSGQLRHAIVSVSNAADAFATLGDLQASLEWGEQALELARRSAMAAMQGTALIQVGNTLRQLGRLQEAERMLLDAQHSLQPVAGSPTWQLTLHYLGELQLDLAKPAQALIYFGQQEAILANSGAAPMIMRTLRGQAKAYCDLGQYEQAMEKLRSALQMAQQQHSSNEIIDLLCIKAELCHRHQLAAPPESVEPNAHLHWLKQALQVAGTIDEFIVPSSLFDTIANAYAEAACFDQAFAYARAAAGAREQQHLADANNRAIAMQVRLDTERAKAEALHHLELAQTESRRAAALQEASQTLETLGSIGREITACLDSAAVFAALYRNVKQLLDVTSFCVYLLQQDGQGLHCPFALEEEAPINIADVPLDHPFALSARCARERQDIFINADGNDNVQSKIPDTLDTQSLLFTPLLVNERLLGVLSIQSLRPHAYAERERSIFRTLSAYGAIALDNASAYALAERERLAATLAREQADHALAELRLTQAKLVQSEKMASLGRLVAGVAHELNTPLGNGLVAASALEEQLQHLQQAVAQGHISLSEMREMLSDLQTAASIMHTSLARGAKLVQTFKQLAVEQSGARRHRFQLQEVLEPVLADFSARLQASPCQLRVLPYPALQLNSFPDVLADVLKRLLENAIQHAFHGRSQGQITLHCKQGSHTGLRILVQDDGNGIAAADLGKVFDPFFTTQFGQGSSGLGLHIAHNAVTQVLGGSLTVFSTPGRGSEFELDLPLVAPYNDRLD